MYPHRATKNSPVRLALLIMMGLPVIAGGAFTAEAKEKIPNAL